MRTRYIKALPAAQESKGSPQYKLRFANRSVRLPARLVGCLVGNVAFVLKETRMMVLTVNSLK